jgi:hypothetical protein
MGNVAQLYDGGAHPVFGHTEAGVQLSVAGSDLAPRQPDGKGDSDQALLRPVVQVALECAPFGVGSSHDAGARGAKLLEAGSPSRVQPLVFQRKAGSRNEL